MAFEPQPDALSRIAGESRPPDGAILLLSTELNFADLTRGPVATPAGHVLLPTHREVMTAAFGLPLLGNCPPLGIAPAPVR